MNNKEMVSVIIPVYNKDSYLTECVDSIVQQDFPCLEILIIDDGSIDNSLIVARELSRKYSNIRVFSQKNSGVSAARNFGILESRGDWLMFVDPDDKLKKFCISSLSDHISEGVDIVAACCEVVEENKRIINYFFSEDRIFSDFESKKDLYMQLMDSQYGQPQKFCTAIGVPWAKLYRKSFLIKNRLMFDVSLKRAQDNVFNMYAFSYANTIKYVNVPVYEYTYSHMDNYFNKYRSDFKIVFCNIYNARKNAVEELGLLHDEDLRKAYLRECCKQVIIIFKNVAFHKKSGISFIKRKKLANELYNSGIFNNVLFLQDENIGLKFKNNCLFRIIQRKYFFLFNLLSILR